MAVVDRALDHGLLDASALKLKRDERVAGDWTGPNSAGLLRILFLWADS